MFRQDKENNMVATNLVSKLIAPFKWLPPTDGNILGQERGQALVRVFVSTIITLYFVYASIDLIHTVPPWLVIGVYALFSMLLFWEILRANTSPTPHSRPMSSTPKAPCWSTIGPNGAALAK